MQVTYTIDAIPLLSMPQEGFEPCPQVAVALSGGADSMALLLLTKDWADQRHGRVIALTVNHRLRAESEAEAMEINQWMQRFGIEHHILELQQPLHPEDKNIQATARKRRYEALETWCQTHGVLHLLTAHHADDVEETLAMRLWRGSGIEGLAGIPTIRYTHQLRIIRPLLHVRKAQLIAFLEQQKTQWVEDASNARPDYERNAVRQQLNKHPLPPYQAATFVAHMAMTRNYLDKRVADCLAHCLHIHADGTATIDAKPMLADTTSVGEYIATAACARLITCLNGHDLPPRSHELVRFYSMLANPTTNIITLGGLIAERSQKSGQSHVWHISREPERIECMETTENPSTLWDRRFRIHFSATLKHHRLTIKALGDVGVAALKIERVHFPTHLTHTGKLGLLSIWHLDQLVAVPHIGYWKTQMIGELKEQFSLVFSPASPLTGFTQTSADTRKAYATTIQ